MSDSTTIGGVNWMRRTGRLCAAGVICWSAAIAGRQSAAPGPLPPALRTHVQSERFDVVTSVRGLPLGVRDELQRMFGSATLDIAEPGAPFAAGAEGTGSAVPSRRLIAAGCSTHYHCLVYYERGGRFPGWRAAIFHWTPAATRFEWGGLAPAGLGTIDDVRKALLAGAIKGEADTW